jgi:hypothetical protein
VKVDVFHRENLTEATTSGATASRITSASLNENRKNSGAFCRINDQALIAATTNMEVSTVARDI